MRRRSVRKPGCTRPSRAKLWIRSPAEISKTSASATSAMMSALRTRPLPSPPPPVRVPDLSELLRSTCDACQAGTSPKMTPVASETSKVNPSTDASSWMLLMRGMFCGTVLISASVPHCAMSNPERAAQPGKQKALGQELPDDAAAAGAHRGAQCDFLSAGRSAREEKIRDVGVRDQQHADDRAKQDIQRGAHIADHVFTQRFGGDAEVGVRLRILFAREPRQWPPNRPAPARS